MNPSDPERARSLTVMADPALWLTYPYLPVYRPRAEGQLADFGVMFDVFGFFGQTGFRATVFHGNLLELPDAAEGQRCLPREVYDTLDEVLDAGWRVD